MNNFRIYTWKPINELSQIGKFGGSWTAIEKREGHSLKRRIHLSKINPAASGVKYLWNLTCPYQP